MTTIAEREWLTVKQFAERNPSLTRGFVYELCSEGKLHSIKVRGKVLVASDALELIASSKAHNGDALGR